MIDIIVGICKVILIVMLVIRFVCSDNGRIIKFIRRYKVLGATLCIASTVAMISLYCDMIRR